MLAVLVTSWYTFEKSAERLSRMFGHKIYLLVIIDYSNNVLYLLHNIFFSFSVEND